MDSTEVDFEFLFRFRDLVAPTIEYHNVVIDQYGSAWWGWWKRPNEPSHNETWERLEALTQNELVIVGLFHSGDGIIYLASVEQIIKPLQDEFGQLQAVLPPEDERHLIPEYYRDSLHNRAWLRIKSISAHPIAFFGEFSLRSLPESPGFRAKQMSRLLNKVIVEADELRTMDTTIWKVRRRRSTDTDQLVLTAAASMEPEAPISVQAISCPGDWILHVTDAHFAAGSFRAEHAWRLESEASGGSTMFEAISSALRSSERRVGAVLCTGDLTFISSHEEFDLARAGLFKFVTGDLSLGLEHLIVVPGNHDIKWTRSDQYTADAKVELAPDEATAPYRNFFEALFRYSANDALSMARRFVFPGGQTVDIVAVNSSSLEQGERFLAGMGRVQEQAYRDAATALNWPSTSSFCLRILALHHHLALTEDLESESQFDRGFGIATNATRILRMAARDGVHLAAHGHKHRAFLWRTDVYELPELAQTDWSLGPVSILGGGSAGSSSVDAESNYFNLLRVNSSVVELEIYRSRAQGAFELSSRWAADVSLGEAGKRASILSPWRKVNDA